LIGYARVSTNGQTLDAQVDALEAAGASVIFQETASGARTDRVELAKAIGALRTGDTLIVTRLDRLARSTRDLLNTLDAIAKRGRHVQVVGRCLGRYDDGARPLVADGARRPR
jgi:DNA invertase Pin-like site-specific DNA recombinase